MLKLNQEGVRDRESQKKFDPNFVGYALESESQFKEAMSILKAQM